MADDRRGTWRWANVPVPEPHVVGLLAGAVLHLLRPWRLTERRGLARVVGLVLTATGLALGGWAVRAVDDADVEKPTALVATGPYAFSRNPMYVAWTLLYAGVGLLLNAAWVFLGLPAVLAATHAVVRQEERELERAFDDYRDYRRDVPRYL